MRARTACVPVRTKKTNTHATAHDMARDGHQTSFAEADGRSATTGAFGKKNVSARQVAPVRMLRAQGRQSILHADLSDAAGSCPGVRVDIPDLKRARIYKCRPPVAHGLQFHDPLFGTSAHTFHEAKIAHTNRSAALSRTCGTFCDAV